MITPNTKKKGYKMETLKSRFALRQEVRDTITGYEGVVIGLTFWLNGCIRVGVQSKTLKDGKPLNPEWFDEQQVEAVALPPKANKKAESKSPGGPMKDPKF